MEKKDYKVIALILVGTMIIALLINFLLSIDGFIASDFSRHEWFSFWTTYTTGVFALIVGYLAISYGNRNSERALQQQNILLLRQESDKIKEEILEEIKEHNLLFNIFDHSVTFVSVNYDDIPGMNARVMKDRALVKARCINWNFMKMLYLSSPNIKEYVDEYDKCWNKSVEILDNYLIIQTNLLLKVQEVDRAVYSMGLYDKQHLILTQKKDLSINKNDEKLDNEIEQAAFGREQQKIIQVQCNKEIAGLVEKLKKLTDGVVNAQDTLTSASISFLSHLNGFTFMRSE